MPGNTYFDEIGGGQTGRGTAYDTCLHRPCVRCGAKAGDRCTFNALLSEGRRIRHFPCLVRLLSS